MKGSNHGSGGKWSFRGVCAWRQSFASVLGFLLGLYLSLWYEISRC